MSVEHVTLRPVAEDDLPALERFLTEPEVSSPFQWFGWWDIRRWRRQWADTGLITEDGGHLMVVRESERLGFVAWRKISSSRTTHYWNMGIALLPDARGKGVGTEAQRQLVRYLFAHTLVKRVEADTESENFAEQRALEKAGFTREGVLRSVVFRDGRWRDGVRYSILREEVAPDGSPATASIDASTSGD
ncbi:GNAT family N-acetyltransferase [Streptomyces siamensis]|uniref:GNAT family N-acetyltransferase n=1 Tax=Streptomyces siamensis TaxID=1274986 RepID=UPI0031EC871C